MSRSATFRKLFAEFLVIVIGVLVALGVDSWVSNLSDRDQERRYLAALATDLRTDSAVLERTARLWEERARAGEVLLRAIESKTIPPSGSLMELIRRPGLISLPQTAADTYEDLVSSGNLGLIKDRDLRFALSNYYRTRPEATTFYERIGLGYRAAARSVLPPRLAEESRDRCVDPMECTEPVGFDRAAVFDRLLRYPDIEGLLRIMVRDLIRGAVLLQGRYEATLPRIGEVDRALAAAS